MKSLYISLLFALFIFTSNKSSAQSSACPIINNSSLRMVTSNLNPCLKALQFDYINSNNGSNRINVAIKVLNIEVVNECYDASSPAGVPQTYTSPYFLVCDLNTMEIIATPYAGNSCNNNGCISIIRSRGSAAPLPVNFTSFNVTRNSNTINLKWETATEINNTGFAVERNSGSTWEEIAFVPTQSTNGNSDNLLTYQFTDNNNTNKGVTQYRIKQIDADKKTTYSDIRAIRGINQDAKTIVYPNPSNNGKVNVVFADASPRDIAIIDMSGRTVKQWNLYSSNTLQIENFTPGMYSIRTVNRETNEITSLKMMVNAR